MNTEKVNELLQRKKLIQPFRFGLKKFVTSTDKDIQTLLEKSLVSIPEDIVLALEEERLSEE